MVTPSRAQFTSNDFQFVIEVLSKNEKEAVSLTSLLSDPDNRDLVLDNENLFAALTDGVGCLRVSPAFYFYILTRRVLKKAGIEERALCDYIASMLASFSHTKQLPAAPDRAARSFAYLCDLMETIAKASPEQVFTIRSYVGDYTLFLSGMFAERVQSYSQRRGAPGLDFYEATGQNCYLTAAQHPQAKQCDLQHVYEQLGREFHAIRMALNHLAENLVHFHEPPLYFPDNHDLAA